MGLFDKLMFWRKPTIEVDSDIHGCFTLPGAEVGSRDLSTVDAGGRDASAIDASAREGVDDSAEAVDVSAAAPD
jgi:hypothetical protein